MIHLYKSKVLSFIAYRTSALYHACTTHLKSVDSTQKSFLRAMNLSAKCIAGFQFSSTMHQTWHGYTWLDLPCSARARSSSAPRLLQIASRQCKEVHKIGLDARRHRRQLVDPRDGSHTELLSRSPSGLIAVYNLLPGDVVASADVNSFQRSLQEIVKIKSKAGTDDWSTVLSPPHPLHAHPLLRMRYKPACP